MRKRTKETLISLIQSLQDLNSNIRVWIESRRYTDALELLKACQEGAISVGTTIEKASNNYSEIIRKLEDYCEEVYQLYANLENQQINAMGQLDKLLLQLNEIKNSIVNDIIVHYEVVFLPYKAAMWDSMESVWTAANDDPTCTCYVIPIPFFELIPNSKEHTLKYEGTELPSYVPTIPVNSYDFKQRMPDIVYIHNPYDQYNNVTSVHPAFYSSVLKDYTDSLVYIPYFVTGGSLSESLGSLPAYQYMDKIITQSESLSRFYEPHVSSDKLLALGSPKIDKVMTLSKENQQMPSEWQHLAKDKKVIFYNTSLSGLYECKAKYLEKMRYVFTCFEGRENELLLWRPHPLVKATLRSTFPELYREYCDLEEEFIEKHLGILDTTSDISLSVAISDAYIGEEGSSVIHLFGAMGKPIFLLNLHSTDNFNENLVGFIDAYINGDEAWFSHVHYNSLCKANMISGEVELLSGFPNELPSGDRLYHDVIEDNNKLYFAPSKAKELAEYDLGKGEFNKYQYEDTPDNVFSRFTAMKKIDQYLYMLPINYTALVRYNIEDQTFKYYSEVVDKLNLNNIEGNQILHFMGSMIQDNEILLMPAAQTNAVIEFDTRTEVTTLHRIGDRSKGFYRMEYDGNNYWMIPNGEGPIVKWNRETGDIKEYYNFPEGFVSGGQAFLAIIPCKDDLLLFPKSGNMIVKINKENGSMSEFKLSLPYKEGERKLEYYNWPNNYYFVKKVDENQIIALTAYDSSLLTIQLNSKKVKVQQLKITKRQPQLMFQNWGSNLPFACREGVLSSLEDFLNFIQEESSSNQDDVKNAYKDVINNMDGTSGLKIHQYFMKELAKV